MFIIRHKSLLWNEACADNKSMEIYKSKVKKKICKNKFEL